MPSDTNKYFSCIYCGAEFNSVKPNDTHTKPNKNKINRDDIETLHKCKECGQNIKLYWSEHQRSK
jgi:transcription elongation factor Elf1